MHLGAKIFDVKEPEFELVGDFVTIDCIQGDLLSKKNRSDVFSSATQHPSPLSFLTFYRSIPIFSPNCQVLRNVKCYELSRHDPFPSFIKYKSCFKLCIPCIESINCSNAYTKIRVSEYSEEESATTHND